MYGEFKFGPLFVRLCYELGLEDLAAATLTDKVNIALTKTFTIATVSSGAKLLKTGLILF